MHNDECIIICLIIWQLYVLFVPSLQTSPPKELTSPSPYGGAWGGVDKEHIIYGNYMLCVWRLLLEFFVHEGNEVIPTEDRIVAVLPNLLAYLA